MTQNKQFVIGLLIGILGGILGNIFVTAMYRVIDKTAGGYNQLTFLTGLIFLGMIIWLLCKIWKI